MKKNFWTSLQRILGLPTQKIVIKLSKIWVWNPRSGIRKKPIPDPWSLYRGQKGTGSRIRIRNTALKPAVWHKSGRHNQSCGSATLLADPDPFFKSFQFNDPDPNPAPHQSDANLGHHWSTGPPRLHFEPLHLHCELPWLHFSILSLYSSWIFLSNTVPDPDFTVTRIQSFSLLVSC